MQSLELSSKHIRLAEKLTIDQLKLILLCILFSPIPYGIESQTLVTQG